MRKAIIIISGCTAFASLGNNTWWIESIGMLCAGVFVGLVSVISEEITHVKPC